MVAGAYLIQVAEFVVVFLTPHNLIIYWLRCLCTRGMDMVELALGDLFGSGCNRTRDLCKRSEAKTPQTQTTNHGSLSGVVFPLWRPGSAGQAQHGEFCWKPSYTSVTQRDRCQES